MPEKLTTLLTFIKQMRTQQSVAPKIREIDKRIHGDLRAKITMGTSARVGKPEL